MDDFKMKWEVTDTGQTIGNKQRDTDVPENWRSDGKVRVARRATQNIWELIEWSQFLSNNLVSSDDHL